MPIKAIIFDIDNTLIDFYHFKEKCMNAALDAMTRAGLKIDRKKAEKITWDIYNKYSMEYKYILQEFLMRVMKKVDYRILARGIIAYRKERANVLVPYPGVKKTIQKLKRKYKLAVISDAPKQKAWLRLALMDIDNLFDVVITFEDTKKKKPHKLPFQIAAKRLQIGPEEILMVGDSIHRDMGGAKSLGMKTCLALYGRTLIPKKNPENVDFMIKKIDDLLKVVKSIK
jgi:putative hydrolase of the HAD superfamily